MLPFLWMNTRCVIEAAQIKLSWIDAIATHRLFVCFCTFFLSNKKAHKQKMPFWFFFHAFKCTLLLQWKKPFGILCFFSYISKRKISLHFIGCSSSSSNGIESIFSKSPYNLSSLRARSFGLNVCRFFFSADSVDIPVNFHSHSHRNEFDETLSGALIVTDITNSSDTCTFFSENVSFFSTVK